jgi:hypothetical protein
LFEGHRSPLDSTFSELDMRLPEGYGKKIKAYNWKRINPGGARYVESNNGADARSSNDSDRR